MNKLPIILVASLIFLTGCPKLEMELPAPAALDPTGSFRAGAARVDITPIPGFPMGGFAAAGKLSRGYWTRLYARAFVFEGQKGHALALVSCDLWAIPAGLADRIAEIVATKYAPRLGREQIIVAATHTHHSPGNYSTSALYNTLASPDFGFDHNLFEFLAHRIAWAVGEAWKKKSEAMLKRMEKQVGGIARNRSLEPFKKNTEGQQIIYANANLPVVETPFPAGGPDAYKAIDATLTVLRADKVPVDPENPAPPIGVLAFYAVHPTSLGPQAEVYNSDLFGVASTLLEQNLKNSVVAFFNGAEGDVSSNWERQDRPAALKLGKRLADNIRDLLGMPGTDVSGPVRFQFKRRDTNGLPEPRAGASMFAGSEGDWAFMRDAGYEEGMKDDGPQPPPQELDNHMHWPKEDPTPEPLVKEDIPINVNGLLDRIGKLPRELPVGVYKIGSVVIGTLPGEFSTVLGRRIAGRIKTATVATGRVLLIGLANEYLSYFTTEKEYDRQHYEGGATLYGRKVGEKMVEELGGLAATMHANPDQPPLRTTAIDREYRPGTRKHFGVRQLSLFFKMKKLQCTYDTLANVLMDEKTGVPTPDNPYFVWVDENPVWQNDPKAQKQSTPFVEVQVKENGNFKPFAIDRIPENDRGLNFVTTLVGSYRGKSRWNTIWMAPEGVDESLTFKIVVKGYRPQPFESEEFTLAEARKKFGNVGFERNP